jgi:putative peptidoglycan lipid II flippase
VAVTGTTLAAYAFGLVALGHAKVVASAFFAQQNTRTPMVGSALSLAVFVAACALLAGPLGVPGLGLANTVAMTAYAALLTGAYARRYGLHGGRVGSTLVAVGRQLAASAAVGWGLWLALPWLAGIERTGAGEALRVLAVLGPVAAAYVALVVLFGGREPAALLAALRGRGRS